MFQKWDYILSEKATLTIKVSGRTIKKGENEGTRARKRRKRLSWIKLNWIIQWKRRSDVKDVSLFSQTCRKCTRLILRTRGLKALTNHVWRPIEFVKPKYIESVLDFVVRKEKRHSTILTFFARGSISEFNYTVVQGCLDAPWNICWIKDLCVWSNEAVVHTCNQITWDKIGEPIALFGKWISVEAKIFKCGQVKFNHAENVIHYVISCYDDLLAQ